MRVPWSVEPAHPGSVLLTRPERQSHETAAELAAHGVPSLIWPLTRIDPVAVDPSVPEGVTALLFTSANGVRSWAAASPRRDLPAYCVGGRTAAEASRLGFEAQSADGDTLALAALACDSAHHAFLHPRGRDVAGNLPEMLATAGKAVVGRIAYEAVETDGPSAEVADALAAGRVLFLTAWSPRGATILTEWLGRHSHWQLSHAKVVAISEAAAEPLRPAFAGDVFVAEEPTSPAMLAKLCQLHAAVRSFR